MKPETSLCDAACACCRNQGVLPWGWGGGGQFDPTGGGGSPRFWYATPPNKNCRGITSFSLPFSAKLITIPPESLLLVKPETFLCDAACACCKNQGVLPGGGGGAPSSTPHGGRFWYATPPPPPPPCPPCSLSCQGSIAPGHTYGGARKKISFPSPILSTLHHNNILEPNLDSNAQHNPQPTPNPTPKPYP